MRSAPAPFALRWCPGSYNEAAWVALELEKACQVQNAPEFAALCEAYSQRVDWLKQVRTVARHPCAGCRAAP
jgi:hypothetical protein